MPAHLYVDISAHGLGHLAQTAPVLAALRARRPGLRLTVASALPRERLAERIAEPFAHRPQASDMGFLMHSAIDIDLAGSAAAYQAVHAQWERTVSEAALALRECAPDLVLANAAYLPLAAAAQAGIPAVGLSSLNWAELMSDVFAGAPWLPEIHAQALAAYRSAEAFLVLTPGLPMADLPRRRVIGPIAVDIDTPRTLLRTEVSAALDLPPTARWVLVAMGGMDLQLPLADWPRQTGTVWLVPPSWDIARDDVRRLPTPLVPTLSMGYTALLSACDAVLTKPGYGTYVEAACHDVPVVSLTRTHWREQEPLIAWMRQHARFATIGRDIEAVRRLPDILEQLWHQPPPPRPVPTGVDAAADWLMQRLG